MARKFQRGRSRGEETRQLEEEMLAHLATLSGDLEVVESAVAPASSGGSGGDVHLHFGLDLATALVYIPIHGESNALGNVDEGPVNWLAPYDCTLESVTILVTNLNDYNLTVVGSHLNGNTTPEDTDSHQLDNDGTVVVFELGTSISAGQRLAISFDGASNGGEVCGYARISR